jgi:hypothetical protein
MDAQDFEALKGIGWPGAAIAIAMICSTATVICTYLTGRWPWDRD